MTKQNKFKPGNSGNPETMFKPGNRNCWVPGVSGNPTGKSRHRARLMDLPMRPVVQRRSSGGKSMSLAELTSFSERLARKSLCRNHYLLAH
jgi:hypothetical protein